MSLQTRVPNRIFIAMNDPFAGIEDEAPQTPTELRAALLSNAHRGYATLRKVFVQQPNSAISRPSILGSMVSSRQENALRLLLLTLALEALQDLRLPPGRWAAMLNAERPCSPHQFSRALQQLEERKLVQRTGTNRLFGLTPLLEDGSGAEYARPTAAGAEVGKGFFIIPDDAWLTGLIDKLRLPGLAMFLVCLHDTHQHSSFQVPLDKMSTWYGISERTAERGYNELLAQNVLRTRVQMIAAPRTPSGLRPITHRALVDPYSKDAREALQAKARTRVRAQNAAATAAATKGRKKRKRKEAQA